MQDNENKELNEQVSNETSVKKVPNNTFGKVWIFLLCYLIVMFLLNNLFGFPEKKEKKLDIIESITLSSFVDETEMRCVGMTAVYDVDGTKNYQVRFSLPNYNMYVDGVVPASLIEEDKVIDKDSKYKANITYTYSNEVLEKVKSKTVFTKKYETDAEYLDVIEKSEDIMRITNIECMFSDYLTLQTEEEVQKEFEDLYLADENIV